MRLGVVDVGSNTVHLLVVVAGAVWWRRRRQTGIRADP